MRCVMNDAAKVTPPAERRLIRVVIVDDHWLERFGLLRLFESARNIAVVGEASSLARAREVMHEQQPDVVIVDSLVPDGNITDFCAELRREHLDIHAVIMSARTDQDTLVDWVTAGATGFILKRSQPELFIAAVQAAAEGRSILDPATTDTVLEWVRNYPGGTVRRDRLSDQQRKILPLIARGMTNRQIADQLYLSEYTVKTYVSGLLKKLHLSRRAEAAAYSARGGLER
jgi:two-component system, NarL family, response regulator DevR